MADDTIEDLQRKVRKLRRTHQRTARMAWAEGFLTAVCGFLRPGDVAIDCGANVGAVSARLLASGADVIAFDPEPWAIEKLQARFAGEHRYHLHNAAVGCTEGTITLFRAANFDQNEKNASVKSTVVSGGRMINEGAGISVPQVDFVAFLQKLIAERGEIAFLKMDIEGAELDLLDAIDRAGLFASIRCTVAETHENKFPDLRPRYASLRAHFAQRYRPEHVNLDWI